MISSIRHIFTLCRFVTLLIMDLLCLLIPRRGGNTSDEKVLIVRLDAIGDFVLWTASLPRLLAPYRSKGCTVSLLSNVSWAAAADALSCFSEVLPLDRSRFISSITYRLRLLARLRLAGYTTVIVPVYSREVLYGDAIIRVSGARDRIGMCGDCTNIRPWLKGVADSWYTRLVPTDPSTGYELQRNADFVSRFWKIDVPLTFPSLPITAPIPEKLQGVQYFVVAPGAQVAGKRWPLQNFREVIEMIQQKSGMMGIICGAPGEEWMGAALSCDCRAEILNYVGRTTLIELIALIAGAKLVLSNDTSAIHIASAVSTPSVCVLGGQHFGRFLPYPRIAGDERLLPVALYHVMPCFQCNWNCPNKTSAEAPFPCVSSIAPNEMWKEAESILSRGAGNASGFVKSAIS